MDDKQYTAVLHETKGIRYNSKVGLIDETLGKARAEASRSIDTKCFATSVEQQPMRICIYLLLFFFFRSGEQLYSVYF